MSARRAAVRRERKSRKKAEKNKSAEGALLRASEEGLIEGRTIAACVVLDVLFRSYGWKKKRLSGFLERIMQQSAKGSEEITVTASLPWQERMIEAVRMKRVYLQAKSITQEVFYVKRNEAYIASCAVMLLVLFSEYGFSTNGKRSGRADRIMMECVERYWQMHENPERYAGKALLARTRELTGLQIS